MGFGNWGGQIIDLRDFFQGLPIAYMDVMERLAHLADKVKMLFIDAYRGSKRDEGVNIISRGAEHCTLYQTAGKKHLLSMHGCCQTFGVHASLIDSVHCKLINCS